MNKEEIKIIQNALSESYNFLFGDKKAVHIMIVLKKAIDILKKDGIDENKN